MSTPQDSNELTRTFGLPPLPPDYLERKKNHHHFLGWAVTRNQLADIGGDPVSGMMHIAAESKRKPIYIAYAVPVFEDDPILSESEKKWLKLEEERISAIIMTYCDHRTFMKKYKLPNKRQIDAITALLGGKQPAWYRDILHRKEFDPFNFA